MSSRRSSSSKRSGGGGSSYYPTQWSEWTWNAQTRRHERYRLKTAEEYEFDYGPVQAEDTPRTYPPLGPIAQPSQQTPYSSQVSYTTTPASDLDAVTRNLAQTTLGSGPSSNYITTRNPHTTTEEFDPHYKLHGAWEFRWGRVFKILWSEPRGNDTHGSTGGNSSNATFSERPGNQGEGPRHEKVRRFVIINAMEGHCICLPIMTYGGQGVNKRGVHAKHHTIIHTNKPIAFRGEKEKGLTKKPIRVDPAGPRHKLDSASRLNYAKTYTVEYNVKVWFIGKVHHNSEWQLTTDYNRMHPPLKARGPPPEDASDDVYFSDQAYSTGSSYPGVPAYSPPSFGTGPNSYSMSHGSGAGTGVSPYLSHRSLDPVEEFESGNPYPSEVYDSSNPQGYGKSEEAYGYEQSEAHDDDNGYRQQEQPREPDQEPAPDNGDLYGA